MTEYNENEYLLISGIQHFVFCLLSDTQNHKSVKTRVNTEEPYIRH